MPDDLKIQVTPTYMSNNHWLVDEDDYSDSWLEFQCMMLATGNALISHDRVLFHGAALWWKDLVWILTGPSGTGKTTQLRHWRKLLKKDTYVMNGDKPLLRYQNDAFIFVYSSPWRGKENYGLRGKKAPLGGIIILEQGSCNKISRLKPEEAVLPLFNEFVALPEEKDTIIQLAGLLEKILDVTPVWKLVNLGDESSAMLTLKTIDDYLKE